MKLIPLIAIPLALVAFNSLLIVHCEEKEEEKINDLAVDITTSQGTKVVIPFFNNTVKTIDPTLAEQLRADANQTLDFALDLIDKRLSNNGKAGIGGDTWAIISLIGMVKTQSAKRKQLKKVVPIALVFNQEMTDMLNESLEIGKKRSGEIKFDYQKLRVDVTKYIQDLKDIITASPVAMYLKFKHAKIDEVEFPVILTDIIARLLKHGFKSFVNGIVTVLKILKTLNG